MAGCLASLAGVSDHKTLFEADNRANGVASANGVTLFFQPHAVEHVIGRDATSGRAALCPSFLQAGIWVSVLDIDTSPNAFRGPKICTLVLHPPSSTWAGWIGVDELESEGLLRSLCPQGLDISLHGYKMHKNIETILIDLTIV